MNILVLTTGSGQGFGRDVTRWLRDELRTQTSGGTTDNHVYRYQVSAIDQAFVNHPEFDPSNTIIHCRAAHPTAHWMQTLAGLETTGYRVINTTASLKLTSDKLRFWETINDAHLAVDGDNRTIYTKQIPKTLTQEFLNQVRLECAPRSLDGVVIKPRYSQGQGSHVHKLTWIEWCDLSAMTRLLASIPSSHILVQQLIPYESIYRVVVIGGVPATAGITYDQPTSDDWKVSVCLNRRQQHFTVNMNRYLADAIADPKYILIGRLGAYAQKIQAAVGGEINFIDIFRTVHDQLVVSEVNTACNLRYHSQITGCNFADWIAKYIVEQIA